VHLPSNMKQQIVIDIRGQAVSDTQKKRIIDGIITKSAGIIKSSDIEFR